MAGLYIHVPFCKQACNYCDFHFSTSMAHKGAFVAALLLEIDERHNYLPSKEVSSIYFGGGTPSLLDQAELAAIMTRLSQYFTWTVSAEITLEANPDDITKEKLQAWKSLGINRLSIGLQSFDAAELTWMKRAHTAIESINSVQLAQEMGFNNISIDLIYGSKFQNLEAWKNTLQQALDLNTQHISAYNLTIENKTELGVKQQKGLEPPVNDALSGEQLLVMKEVLAKGGFMQYEVSNFAKENFIAQHNSSYWQQMDYLGLGPSAHSYNGLSRQWNVKNNQLYIQALNNKKPYFEIETLTTNNLFNEYLLTRLRTMWGCDLMEIEARFGKRYSLHFQKTVNEYTTFFTMRNNIYLLNEMGMLRADAIASDFFML